MAEINNDEKRIGVSGEQIEEAVGKVPTIEADVKENKQSISALQTASAQHTADISSVNATLENKANADEVYSREETDNAITAKVAEIVAGAPEEFDTLKEMSDWLTEHSGSAAEMNTAIQANTKAIADNATAIEGNTADIEQNKSDILSAENGIAVNRHTLGTQCKNIFDILSFQSATKTATRATVENVENGIKITANVVDSLGKKGDAYTNSYDKSNNHYKIPVNPNTKYIISWNADNNNSGRNYVFFNGVTDNNEMRDNSLVKNFSFTTPPNTTFITVRFGVTEYEKSITYTNIMIRPADITDNTYEPYVPSVNERLVEVEKSVIPYSEIPSTSTDEQLSALRSPAIIHTYFNANVFPDKMEGWGTVIVTSRGGSCTQTVFRNDGCILVRGCNTDGVFSSWYKFTGSALSQT